MWRGVRRMHFVMHAFNNHVEVLYNVTPIDFDVCNVFNEHNIRFCTKLRHLTYWLKWRVHSAIIGDSITPATPPQEGNGPAPCLYRHEATTP